jgi:hypothetical protein
MLDKDLDSMNLALDTIRWWNILYNVHMGVNYGGKEEPDGVRGVSELLANVAPLPGHRRILSHAQLLQIKLCY